MRRVPARGARRQGVRVRERLSVKQSFNIAGDRVGSHNQSYVERADLVSGDRVLHGQRARRW